MNLSCTMKTGWQIILIVIPVVEVTQEWIKWHGIDELALHQHEFHLKGRLLGRFPL